MQDKEAPCFLFATANNISQLPSEFLRRGRFDQKFYVFMPMEKDCVDIFKAVLKECNSGRDKDNNKIELFDSDILSEEFIREIVNYCGRKEKFLIGADIDGIVHDAMAQVYFDNNKMKYAPGEYKYKKNQFKEALKAAIDDTKTYGETNISDIAECYISLYENKFKPAAGDDRERILINFSSFNPKRDPAIDLADKKPDNYNAVLFNKIKTEINSQIHEKLEYKRIYGKN
jgi:SpoVK/Ycf46/Vps4 family AAA+-type ATPase